MNQLQEQPRASPEMEWTTIQNMVADSVVYHLENSGPAEAREVLMHFAKSLSYRDEWPAAYRWALKHISDYEKKVQQEAEKQEQSRLAQLMITAMSAANHRSAPSEVEQKRPKVPEQRITRCLELLMQEKWSDGKPLFNQQNHWQAVYRILVDKGYCRDSDFDGFDAFILSVMPEKVNKPYKKESLKQISQTDFVRSFDKWSYDPKLSGTRKPYDRMLAVASQFKEILERKDL